MKSHGRLVKKIKNLFFLYSWSHLAQLRKKKIKKSCMAKESTSLYFVHSRITFYILS